MGNSPYTRSSDWVREARAAGRGLHLHVLRAGKFLQDALHFGGGFINRLEVLAEHVDHDRGGFAGDAFANAVAEEGEDFALQAGVFAQQLADFLHQVLLLLAGRAGLQLDVELTAVRTPRVLALRGATDLLLDRRDVFVRRQLRGNLVTDAHHLGERRAGRGGNLQHEVAFAELGQELLAHAGQLQRRRRAHEHDERDDEAGGLSDFAERSEIAALEPRLQLRFLRLAHALAEHEERERGRERERDQQRRHDGDDVGERERRESAHAQPLYPRSIRRATGGQMVSVSTCSPHTFRRTSLISPTVPPAFTLQLST